MMVKSECFIRTGVKSIDRHGKINNYIQVFFLAALFMIMPGAGVKATAPMWKDSIPTLAEVGSSRLPPDIAPVKAPFKMPAFKKPSFNNLSLTITERGADAAKLCTPAIQKSIDEVSSRGGGTVVIPKGVWKTGRIILKSNVNLHFADGAELHFSGDIKDYLPVVFTRTAGVEGMSLGACIYANGQQNIAITGNGRLVGPEKGGSVRKQAIGYGTIEEKIDMDKPASERIFDGRNGTAVFSPTFIGPVNCKDVYIEGVSLEQSAFWNIVPTYCEGVIIRGVTVYSVGIPMGDGMDIESCKNVLIEYCTLSTGDDCFTIKAGRGIDGLRVNKPSENIVVRHSLARTGHGGITCGSETAGMIRNVYVHDCVFDGTGIGIRFKTRRPRGGGGENLYYERIRMNLKGTAVTVDMLGSSMYVGNLANGDLLEVNELTPLYRNIVIKDIIVEAAAQFVKINGIPESPLKNFLLENARVNCNKLITINNARRVTFRDIKVQSRDSLIQVADAGQVSFEKVHFTVPGNEVFTRIAGNMPNPVIFKDCRPARPKISR